MKIRDKYLVEAPKFGNIPAAGEKSKIMDLLMDIGYGGEEITDIASATFNSFGNSKMTAPEVENNLKKIIKDARDIAVQATQAMTKLKSLK